MREDTTLGDISEKFSYLPKQSQGGNYSSAKGRIYVLSAYRKSLV